MLSLFTKQCICNDVMTLTVSRRTQYIPVCLGQICHFSTTLLLTFNCMHNNKYLFTIRLVLCFKHKLNNSIKQLFCQRRTRLYSYIIIYYIIRTDGRQTHEKGTSQLPYSVKRSHFVFTQSLTECTTWNEKCKTFHRM